MIREVTIDDVFIAITPLFVEHREETTTNKELMQLKPDMERYRLLEVKNILLVLAAYLEGKLVGYSVTFIDSHLHYADLVCANNDLIFVQKEYRNTKIGLNLIQETERIAKERGAKFMLWHAKEDTALSNLLPRMGCSVQDIVYSKEL